MANFGEKLVSPLHYENPDWRKKSRSFCAPIVKSTEDLQFKKKYHWKGNFNLILKMVFKLKIKPKMTKLWVPKKGKFLRKTCFTLNLPAYSSGSRHGKKNLKYETKTPVHFLQFMFSTCFNKKML